jgi:hypothetical protein
MAARGSAARAADGRDDCKMMDRLLFSAVFTPRRSSPARP